jgi:hypothetical protein
MTRARLGARAAAVHRANPGHRQSNAPRRKTRCRRASARAESRRVGRSAVPTRGAEGPRYTAPMQAQIDTELLPNEELAPSES